MDDASKQVVLPDPAHHITGIGTYIAIFVTLLVLTAITTSVAFIDLGWFSTPVALLIAVCKASLVILFFMHVRNSTRLTWVIVLSSFFMLGVMFVLTLSDYMSRGMSMR